VPSRDYLWQVINVLSEASRLHVEYLLRSVQYMT